MNEGVEMNTSDNMPANKDRARKIFRFNFKSLIIGIILGIILGSLGTYFYGGRYVIIGKSEGALKYDRWTGTSWVLHQTVYWDMPSKYYWEQLNK